MVLRVLKQIREGQDAGRRSIACGDAFAIGLQLCSACRGDYEDPDASAMNDESSLSGDDEESDSDLSEKFPARCERR